jgi:hypothetical protein
MTSFVTLFPVDVDLEIVRKVVQLDTEWPLLSERDHRLPSADLRHLKDQMMSMSDRSICVSISKDIVRGH